MVHPMKSLASVGLAPINQTIGVPGIAFIKTVIISTSRHLFFELYVALMLYNEAIKLETLHTVLYHMIGKLNSVVS